MRLRKTKLTEKICVKCRGKYASFHHSTKYCQKCFDLVKIDEDVKYQLKDLKWWERHRKSYLSESIDTDKDKNSIIKDIEVSGSVKTDYSTYPDFLQNVKPIKKEKPRIIDVDDVEEFDQDYLNLLNRIRSLNSPSCRY